MLKKILAFIITLILLLIFSTCQVNENTGLITINNTTNNDISSIKIGNTMISCYLSKGSKVDYWFYYVLTGSITGSGMSKAIIVEEDTADETRDPGTSLVFKLNHQYKIDIIDYNNQNWFYIYSGTKVGSSYEDDDKDKPWD
jgi:regulatory protein YycI of two-component signal transduction system YycFG